jgi:hypothetical protein
MTRGDTDAQQLAMEAVRRSCCSALNVASAGDDDVHEAAPRRLVDGRAFLSARAVASIPFESKWRD